MTSSIIFHCNYLSANVGIPGINQSVIADLLNCGESSLIVYGSDYEKYYQFFWAEDGTRIETREVERANMVPPSFAMFTGFDSVQKMIPQMIQWRRQGCHIGFWNWGYLTKQQSNCNWNSGKVPLWVKRCAIYGTRKLMGPLVDFYIVSSNAEKEDSNIKTNQCLQMPMGRPQSAIFKECDTIDAAAVEYLDEGLTYIGRGNWETKGVSNLVHYARSEKGKGQRFRFFISTKEAGFDERVSQHKASNIEWYDDVFGKDNLPWLQKSAAFITVNFNPVQIRTPYESLYSGTPIVMYREGYMDGFKSILDAMDLPDAVQIIEPVEIETGSLQVATLDTNDRLKLAETMRVVLNAKEFSEWFSAWLRNPQGGASYYEHIKTRLLGGK